MNIGEDGVTLGKLNRRRFLGTAAAIGSVLAIPNESGATPASSINNREISFDADWRFFRGDPAGAEKPAFDDSAWRELDLPHDWSIEDAPGAPARTEWKAPAAIWSDTARRPVEPGEVIVLPVVPPFRPDGPPRKVGPFDVDTSAGSWGSGWTVGGTGWYRKRFMIKSLAVGERLEIRFDGVYHDAEVWLNGALLGAHNQGHSGFAFDLTPHLVNDRPNVLAVRARNEGFTSRWYNGSGIYRHVWLTRTRDVRVPLWGVFVSTKRATEAQASVTVRVEVENRGRSAAPVDIKAIVKTVQGRVVGSASATATVRPGVVEAVRLEIDIKSPRLWHPEDPALHMAEVVLVSAGDELDRVTTSFGIRTISVNAETGFMINGVPLKLKGACIHLDHGLLGSAAYDRAEVRRVELLKANGFNAIRCSHNLFALAFYDACDRLGMIVIDEMFDVWNEPKLGYDLGSTRFKTHWKSDISDMVRRDRNHPSIAFWSIGNEIPERNAPLGVRTAAALRKAILELDDTRLITAALEPGVHGKDAEPSRRGLDVVGYNYMQFAYEKDQADNPGMVFMGSEQYAKDIHDAWRKVEKFPWLIGDFVWTAMDYIGEVGAGSSQLRRNGERPPPLPLPYTILLWDYPFFQSGCGEIDLIGLKKPQGLYRDVLWNRSKLELMVQRPTPAGFHEELADWAFPDELASWTWPDAGAIMTIRAYTAGDEVRIFLNDREMQRKAVAATDKLTAEFKLPYAPGTLMAIAYRGGIEIARKSLQTVGKPAKLRLRAERDRVASTPGELAYVYAKVCDAKGRLVPDAQVPLVFSSSGPARLLASGSANPRGIESFTDNYCTSFHGVAQAIFAPIGKRGDVEIAVSSPGLTKATATLAFG